MLTSELIAALQIALETTGDIEVVDSEGMPIEEVSWPCDNGFNEECNVLYSEGDEH